MTEYQWNYYQIIWNIAVRYAEIPSQEITSLAIESEPHEKCLISSISHGGVTQSLDKKNDSHGSQNGAYYIRNLTIYGHKNDIYHLKHDIND